MSMCESRAQASFKGLAKVPSAQSKEQQSDSAALEQKEVCQLNSFVDSSSYTDLRSSNVLDSEDFLPLPEQHRIYLKN